MTTNTARTSVMTAAVLWLMTMAQGSVMAVGADLQLLEAVQRQDRAAVRTLLKEGVDVNVSRADGATALAWAVHWDDQETADLLIRAGADVDAANELGVTPLMLAARNGSAAMIEKLLRAHAGPNVARSTGETALFWPRAQASPRGSDCCWPPVQPRTSRWGRVSKHPSCGRQRRGTRPS